MNLLTRLTSPRTEARRGYVQIVPTWTNNTESARLTYRQAYLANSILHAVINARAKVFSEVRFAWRRNRDGNLFTNQDLSLLERPWPGGTGTELLTRMIQSADLTGNAYVYRAEPDILQILDAGKVEVVTDGRRKLGYNYWADGIGSGDPRPIQLDEMAHWAPIPHPSKAFVGVSWVSVVMTELQTDIKMLKHQERFFDNAATPNLWVKVEGRLSPDSARKLREDFDRQYSGFENAWKIPVLDGSADLRAVGASAVEMDYINVQKSTEARIASAGGVPPIIIALKAGLDASTYSNYAMAMRAFADHTIRPLWNSAVASLDQIVETPGGTELWYDDRSVAALRQDAKLEAEIQRIRAEAIRTYLDAGFDPDAAIRAVAAGDLAILEGTHSGLFSVQLQEPGTEETENANDGDAEPAE